LEVKRYEKAIKENTNLVDNMIAPQLKAIAATFNEHREKYKKLKQAAYILEEREKKAERELKERKQQEESKQEQSKREEELRYKLERLESAERE